MNNAMLCEYYEDDIDAVFNETGEYPASDQMPFCLNYQDKCLGHQNCKIHGGKKMRTAEERMLFLNNIQESEINYKIECFWDTGFTVTIGDEQNGWTDYVSDCNEYFEDAIDELVRMVLEYDPNSTFSQWYHGNKTMIHKHSI